MPENLYNVVNQVNTAARNERIDLPQTIQSARAMRAAAAGICFFARVVSSATGAGYYNCYLQTLDATNWNTDNSLFADTGGLVVIFNSVENAALDDESNPIHDLSANDLIFGIIKIDDEGNARHVGLEVFGRHTFGEQD